MGWESFLWDLDEKGIYFYSVMGLEWDRSIFVGVGWENPLPFHPLVSMTVPNVSWEFVCVCVYEELKKVYTVIANFYPTQQIRDSEWVAICIELLSTDKSAVLYRYNYSLSSKKKINNTGKISISF